MDSVIAEVNSSDPCAGLKSKRMKSIRELCIK